MSYKDDELSDWSNSSRARFRGISFEHKHTDTESKSTYMTFCNPDQNRVPAHLTAQGWRSRHLRARTISATDRIGAEESPDWTHPQSLQQATTDLMQVSTSTFSAGTQSIRAASATFSTTHSTNRWSRLLQHSSTFCYLSSASQLPYTTQPVLGLQKAKLIDIA